MQQDAASVMAGSFLFSFVLMAFYTENTYVVQTTVFVKIRANHDKKSSKFTKKITHVDDIMIHNLVKYLVQIRLRL